MSKVHKIAADIADILVCKNNDYGNSYHDLIDRYGKVAAIIPLENKMNRLRSLIKSEALVNESIKDTLTDLAGYTIKCLEYLEITGGSFND